MFYTKHKLYVKHEAFVKYHLIDSEQLWLFNAIPTFS